MLDMRRREFVTLLGGAAATWPLAAGAQQAERMRRIGVLVPYVADDPEAQARMAAFQQALAELGWIDGRNLRIDTRLGAERAGIAAISADAEMIRLRPIQQHHCSLQRSTNARAPVHGARQMSALTSMVTSLIAHDPGHNQSVDVSYFAQTPNG
jgi:hypothetical protein